jgi:ribose 5-phosphate isomerase A
MDDRRDRAALAAVGEVRAGMIVGLGSGDTASRAIVALAARALDITTIATSEKSAALARAHGLTVIDPDDVAAIDVTIDGADEIDPQLRLLKGRGGALTREKLVARASKRLVIVADDDKLVQTLGDKHRLPVELLRFGSRWTLDRLRALGLDPILREGVTDNGGLIADCLMTDPARLAIPGVMAHGLFLDEASVAYIGHSERVDVIER